MEKYSCPVCNKTTYTAYSETAHICPYCNTEKMLILNQKAFSGVLDISDTRVIFDRRTSEHATAQERRGKEDVELIPIAWLVIKRKSSATDVTDIT